MDREEHRELVRDGGTPTAIPCRTIHSGAASAVVKVAEEMAAEKLLVAARWAENTH